MGPDDDVVRMSPFFFFHEYEYRVPIADELFTQTLSLLNRAWKSGFDVLMLTVDTWQLGWRPTDINIANYA